jgi:proliferating cell nuclear antigen
MEFTIRDSLKSDTFATVFQHLKLFTEQVTLVCNDKGIQMQCMDSGRVSIEELSIPNDWFAEYHIEDGVTTRIGFNATFLYRILSSREKEQQIHFVYTSHDTDNLMVHLTSSDGKKSFDTHYELPLIDINEDEFSIPEVEYTAEMCMLSAQFFAVISKLKLFGDSMEVNCCEEMITLTSTSHDQGKMTVKIEIDDLSEFSIDEGANLSLFFSLVYLKNICAYHKISENVKIRFSDTYPMRVDYDLGENATLMFYLAPKMDE